MSRYTEAQVRRDPHLRELAEEYARRYDGEFLPVVAAQGQVLGGATLTDAVAKTVLNIARVDPRVSHLLPEAVDPMVGFSLARPASRTTSSAFVHKPIRQTIERPAKPRGAFFWSEDVRYDADIEQRLGRPPRHVFHAIGTSIVRWHPDLGPMLIIRALCGARPSVNVPAGGDHPPAGWAWCGNCWTRVRSAAPTEILGWTCGFRDECTLPAGHAGAHPRPTRGTN